MKKIFLSVFLAAFLALGIASVGYCSINAWGRTDTNRLLGKVMPGYLQSTGTAIAPATSLTSTQVAIPVSYCYVQKAVANDDNYLAGTLENGTKGQLLTIFITENSGGKNFVVTPTTTTGFTSLTFDAAKDQATLLYIDDTTGWVLLSSTSVTVQ